MGRGAGAVRGAAGGQGAARRAQAGEPEAAVNRCGPENFQSPSGDPTTILILFFCSQFNKNYIRPQRSKLTLGLD